MARNSANTDEELTTGPTRPGQARGRGRTKTERAHAEPVAEQPADPAQRGGGGLERVTVNLIPRAVRALEQAGRLTGDSKTDTINRALQVYAYLEEMWAKGAAVMVKDGDNVTELKFF